MSVEKKMNLCLSVSETFVPILLYFCSSLQILYFTLFSMFSVHYLTYGPFSSHAPMYDTSFSNISKEESDLLLSTYGDESGVQYADR